MNKIFLIAFIILTMGVLIAQDKKSKTDSISFLYPVEVITKISVDSSLCAQPIFLTSKIYTAEICGIVSCFDSAGTLVWKRQMSSGINSKPVLADGQMAVGTINSEINSLSASDGSQIQSIGIDDSITTNLISFDYKGSKELFLPKQSSSRTALIFGTKTGNIYCLDLETLQEYWRNSDAKGIVSSQPVIVENKILFSCSDGYLYSIDARSGLLNWRWKETEETDFSNTSIICDGKKVFLVAKDLQLYCIDLLLGKLIWKDDNSGILPAIGLSKNRKELFAKTTDRKFLIISSDKGKILKQIRFNGDFDNALIPAVESSARIYFTNRNSLFALDNKFNKEVMIEFHDSVINSFQSAGRDKFIVSTSNGTILVFRPRK